MWSLLKAIPAVVRLLNFVVGQIERWQQRRDARIEAEHDSLAELANALRRDKELEDRLRRDPALLDRVRKHYRRQ